MPVIGEPNRMAYYVETIENAVRGGIRRHIEGIGGAGKRCILKIRVTRDLDAHSFKVRVGDTSAIVDINVEAARTDVTVMQAIGDTAEKLARAWIAANYIEVLGEIFMVREASIGFVWVYSLRKAVRIKLTYEQALVLADQLERLRALQRGYELDED